LEWSDEDVCFLESHFCHAQYFVEMFFFENSSSFGWVYVKGEAADEDAEGDIFSKKVP
jgi:hypothetical protein